MVLISYSVLFFSLSLSRISFRFHIYSHRCETSPNLVERKHKMRLYKNAHKFKWKSYFCVCNSTITFVGSLKRIMFWGMAHKRMTHKHTRKNRKAKEKWCSERIHEGKETVAYLWWAFFVIHGHTRSITSSDSNLSIELKPLVTFSWQCYFGAVQAPLPTAFDNRQ